MSMPTTLNLASEPIELLPSGAIYLPQHHTLLVADAHFGKASSFRQLGVPVPSGTTNENLLALTEDLKSTQAQQLIFLGDFLHSRYSHTSELHAALLQWREEHAHTSMLLIRGNHDSRAGDPPIELRIKVVDEPHMLGAFALCHHPQSVADKYTLAGHWHPCITLQGKARERLRLPCFWLGNEAAHPLGILPAYGSFTGMHPIERRDSDAVFAVAGDVVRKV
jgi:uncharacterized protein